MSLSQSVSRKFEESFNSSSWEVLSHDGWRDIKSSNKTIPYDVYTVILDNGVTLECADTHILITSDMEEVFAIDSVGCEVTTIHGPSVVISITPTNQSENMYDLTVDGDHLYYTNGVLSHNTQLMALYGLHEITFQSEITTGVTSFKLTNVRDILKRLKYTYESLPNFLKAPVTTYNTGEVSFTNHSSVYGEVTSESALRGKTVTGTAIIDEFAFSDPAIAEEFITSFLPALEAAGEESTTKVVIISTPNSTTGKYAEIVHGAIDGSNGWVYHKVDPAQIPGRTDEWKKKMIRKLGINRFRQEFEGYFLSDNSSLVNSSVIEEIKPTDPFNVIGELKLFVDSLKGRKVAIGVDVSEGVGKDNSCFQLIDVGSLQQIGEYAYNMHNQNQYFAVLLKTIHYLYKNGVLEIYMAVESNGIGNGILRLIENSQDDMLSNVVMLHDVNDMGVPTGKPGFSTTNKTKMEGCGLLKEMVEEGKLTLRSHPLLNELRMYTKQGSTFKAERGAKDDRVMALVIVMNMFKQIANYEDNVYDVINEVSMSSDDDDWGIMF
jgi:hypothetical protein